MSRYTRQFARSVLVSCLTLGGLAFPAASAFSQSQDTQDTGRAGQAPRQAPDFLLGRPSGSLGVRGSWVFSRAGSDIFDFVQDQLTIDEGAFNRPAFAADLSFALGRQLDIVGGFQYSKVTISSEYRDLVDNNFLPITQQTGLKEMDLNASLKWAISPRGREVSRFVWVPNRVVPYVGGGGGAMWYEFKQRGDFVDFVDSSVFPDFFQSTGWTPSVHVFGGADVHVYKRLYVTLEGRYLWASGKLGPDFIDFDPMDLAGFRLAAGINVLY